jgi:hypothetical protein
MPAPRPEDFFENLATRAAPMPNIDSRRDAQISGEYVQQASTSWHLPPPSWVRPEPVYGGRR